MATSSYPDFHVTGPVHHFIRTPRTDQTPLIYYLGTAEVTPQIKHQRLKKDVFNSIGGTAVPMQRLDYGEVSVIGSLLNRFSKVAIVNMKTAGISGFAGNVIAEGWRSRFSRGALAFGRTTVELWMVNENYGTAFATTGMEIGRYFPVFDIESFETPEIGTVDEKALILGTAFPLWIPQSSPSQVGNGERSWKMYSTDPADFPADVLVPQ